MGYLNVTKMSKEVAKKRDKEYMNIVARRIPKECDVSANRHLSWRQVPFRYLTRSIKGFSQSHEGSLIFTPPRDSSHC